MISILRQMKRMQFVAVLALVGLTVSACSMLNTSDDTQTVYQGSPVVTIASPLMNDTYQEGVGVNILVRVENAGSDVARVAIEVDGQIIGEALLPNPAGAPSFTVRNGWPALGVGQHIISVLASRADGTVSAPASTVINVVAAPQGQTNGDTGSSTGDSSTTIIPTLAPTQQTVQDQPTNAPQPTNPPQPTDSPQPTNPPAPTGTPTPSRPQVRVQQGANVRSGPGTNFNPPVGSLAAGATSDILALNLDGTWYKIRYYNGDAWIFGGTVDVVGDITNIPREAGPPTPVPYTATPVATNTPVASADLSITAASTGPFPFECGRASEIRVTIANSGTGNSGETTVVVEDLYNGQVIESTSGPVRALAPGENTQAVLYLTVSTYIMEGHISRVRVDPENRVPETNEGNNADEDAYVLQGGSC